MPSKNIEKEYVPNSYYHIYNRGVEKRMIFIDDNDYVIFLNIVKRYLSKEVIKDTYGRDGVTYYGEIELQAFCLMPNHFHLLIYIADNPRLMTELLRRICTSYTMYFNKKYKRVGHLFQGRFKASRITTDAYLQHISRYIHLNPENYTVWKYSSLPYYIKGWQSEWVKPQRIIELFEGESYGNFLADYEGQREILEELKHELADS